MRIGGLDVGQRVDHTCLVALRQEAGLLSPPDKNGRSWWVDRVDRLPLGLPFVRQLALLGPELDRLDMLVVDSGGTGQALPELIAGARLTRLVPAAIVGGNGRGRVDRGRVTVGKAHLVHGLLDMIRRGRLRVDPEASGRELLERELVGMEYQPGGGFRRMEAARGGHDDAVMALALAAWLARTVESER